MHYFPGLDEQKILWEVSYQNLSMYLATIPTYDTGDDDAVEHKGELTAEEIELKQLEAFFKAT